MYSTEQKKIYLQNASKISTLGTAKEDGVPGTYLIANDPEHYEIQRSNHFEFVVEGLDELLVPTNTWVQGANARDVIRISTSKAFVPHFTQSALTVKRGNSTVKFAGSPEFGNGTIDLDDFIGAGTKDLLYAWQQKSYNVRTEKVGLASDYKKIAHLIEYTPDLQMVRMWELMGCWLSSLEFGEYNAESNDKQKITATLEYDKGYLVVDEAE